MNTLPGVCPGDVGGDAALSSENVLVFVSSDVAQPPSAAAASIVAITTARFIVTCLLAGSLALWMRAAAAPSHRRKPDGRCTCGAPGPGRRARLVQRGASG